MAKTKSTKRALIMSILSLVICITMLIGTTYAWFTDSVTSGSNIIKSGNLDVALVDESGASLEGEVIEFKTADNRAQDAILWEPGCTYHTENFYVENKGNLNLKFKVIINGIDGDAKLLEAIDFTALVKDYEVTIEHPWGMYTTTTDIDLINGTTIETAFGETMTFDEFILEPGDKMGPIVLTGHMKEEAGNEYEDLTIEGISVSVIATQAIGEEDSFDGMYDKDATYPEVDTVERDDDTAEDTLSAGDVDVTVPAGADEGAYKLHVSNENQATDANNNTTVSYDITLTKDGVKVSGNIEFPVSIYVGEGLNITSVKHNGEEIANYTYTSSTGIVSFVTKSFSPFSITYNRGPIADVSNSDITDVNATWGMGGAADAIELDTAFEFKTTETYEEAQQSEFKYWHADFVVSTDKDVKANSLALAGYYEAYCKDYNNNNWVALISDADIEANTEIRLLELMLNGGSMSYQELCQYVPTFLCGAADLDGSNKGTTLKVELRLYEVENNAASTSAETGEYITVGTYAYTF